MTATFYDHWHHVPEATWRWKKRLADRGLPAAAQVSCSSTRSPRPAAGGAPQSTSEGDAFDIGMSNHDPVSSLRRGRAFAPDPPIYMPALDQAPD